MEEVANPTWADVEREIDALDARTRTLVTLAPASPLGAPAGDAHMAIGGGKEGRFIVYVTADNLTFWNLTDPERQGDDRTLCMLIGGQEGEYRAAQLVNRAIFWTLCSQARDTNRGAVDRRRQ